MQAEADKTASTAAQNVCHSDTFIQRNGSIQRSHGCCGCWLKEQDTLPKERWMSDGLPNGAENGNAVGAVLQQGSSGKPFVPAEAAIALPAGKRNFLDS